MLNTNKHPNHLSNHIMNKRTFNSNPKPLMGMGSVLTLCLCLFLGLPELLLEGKTNQVTENKYEFSFYYLKYSGGGDWYEGKVGAKNLMGFINKQTNKNKYVLKCNPEPDHVSLGDSILFDLPFIYMTGHGNVVFNANERKRLKQYLLQGGFLYANDDYGLDKPFTREIKAVFPDKKWTKIPNNHALFKMFYEFPKGSPKIHKHDGGPPETYALYHEGRIIILYSKNTDIGDGWAPYQVHKDPEKLRTAALQFGINIILFALSQ